MNRKRSSLSGRMTLAWMRVKRFLMLMKAEARPFVRRHPKECAVFAALGLMLLGPFLLRPAERTAPAHYNRRLVIMTPHYEAIRLEFGRAFSRLWKQKTGEVLYIDWRVQGASELTTMIRSDFTTAFQRHWQHDLKKKWTNEIASTFLDAKTAASDEARATFLKSNVGIGVDVLFGGGPYDFQAHADAGMLVAVDEGSGAGMERIHARHEDWFGNETIPDAVSGQLFHAKDMTWCGTCLSSFGIVFNRDVLKRLGIDKEPTQWSDLADPRLFGQVALADPSKSASVAKAFEMIIQQQMHQAIDELTKRADPMKKVTDMEQKGVKEGWTRGMALIQKISANARYFTDAAPKIPLEVAKGDAAVGMCIDFYGRSAQDEVRRTDGSSRVGFIAPEGGTAVSVDPIAIMRGAAEPELAEAFVEFVLSEAGQKLWNYKVGTPGGPESASLRRLPIRRDMYSEASRSFMADADERPFEKAQAFVYRPEWTGGMFNALRFLVRVMCVDTHPELRESWQTLINNHVPAAAMRQLPNTFAQGGTTFVPDSNIKGESGNEIELPRSLEILHGLQSVGYDYGNRELASILRSSDKVPQVREARRLTDSFRIQYAKAAQASGR